MFRPRGSGGQRSASLARPRGLRRDRQSRPSDDGDHVRIRRFETDRLNERRRPKPQRAHQDSPAPAMASHRLVPTESPVASSSSATRRFCDHRSFHSQRAPTHLPKKVHRGSTRSENCFPGRRCCTRTATATVEQPSPVVCPWQAMSPSDGQPVASDPASPRTDRVSAGRALEDLPVQRGVNPIGTRDEQTFRTPHRVVEPTSTTIRRRHTDPSEDRHKCVSQQEPKTPSRGSVPFSGVRCIDRYALGCLPSAIRSQGFSPSQRFAPDAPS